MPSLLFLGKKMYGFEYVTVDSKKVSQQNVSVAIRSDKSKNTKQNLYTELRRKATIDEGMFTIYLMDDKYYFEIPDSLLKREILIVTRRERSAMDLGFAGELIYEKILTLDRRNDKFIHLRVKSYRKIADEGTELHDAVASCMEPAIIKSLPIKAFSKDSTSTIVDVTDLFREDILGYELNDELKKKYALSSLEDNSCYIEHMKSFPMNIEVSSVKTYKIKGESRVLENEGLNVVTLVLHNSLLLLPEKPMMPRYADERVGYFYHRLWDYGIEKSQRATREGYVHRWRLEPSDVEAFRSGKLVEPKKPIIFYLSSSIPQQWRKYFIQGVEDWQPAFERAGFKNAIKAMPIPSKEKDPDFDPLDARYSMIEYFPSYVENSYGPHVFDPRSGEIIESHVCIFHNVLKYVHDSYMILAGPLDERARKPIFEEELMGRLMRYLVSHEVGHVLGLMHNFAGSSACPVDSLRSSTFTHKYGTASSIMDYARFNCVAQPGDENINLIPIVSEYDKYAIEWGYRPILDAKNPEDERIPLNNFIKAHADDPMYRYIRQSIIQNDPRGQTEDLGEDNIIAAEYALKNLKIVFDNLQEWTLQEGHDNSDLKTLYDKCVRQWSRYMRHVGLHLSGIYENYKSADQPGRVYSIVERDKQKKAIEFLSKYAFEAPDWIINQPYISRFDMSLTNTRKFIEQQAAFIKRILNIGVLLRMIDNYDIDPENGYNPLEYLKDTRYAVWKDLYAPTESTANRRVLQRVYLDESERWLMWKNSNISASKIDTGLYEYKTYMRLSLQELQKEIKNKLAHTTDIVVCQHYRESLQKIENMLNPKKCQD